MNARNDRWEAFLKAHPKPVDLLEEEKAAMFLHGWSLPDRNVDEYHDALWKWREEVMEHVALFNPRP